MAQCEQLRAEIERLEGELPKIPDRHDRASVRVQLMMRRARLDAVISELRGTEDHVLRLARERWPQWRI